MAPYMYLYDKVSKNFYRLIPRVGGVFYWGTHTNGGSPKGSLDNKQTQFTPIPKSQALGSGCAKMRADALDVHQEHHEANHLNGQSLSHPRYAVSTAHGF